ncbi:MAG: molybdate ABC transporter substrate-binding protein, partial [Prevotellaceae bacterium]|nr:molybdate ABC transporter substrate-binding protein [Prevotellaceae bacterium]
LANALMLSLCSCGTKESTVQRTSKELIVFSASSLTETLSKIGDAYMAENPDIKIIFNFDSSGTLKTQIQEGADVDIFISAGQKQMDQLDVTASKEINTDGLDYVLKGSRFNIFENKVVLAVPSDNPSWIQSYDDMISKFKNGSIMLAMGNSDVPAGQYAREILAYYGISENDPEITKSISYGSNVKEVTTQVSEGTVDCGIIYQTDAYSAGLTIVDTATKEMCGEVIYPAAIMNVSNNPEVAKAFLDYLMENENIWTYFP